MKKVWYKLKNGAWRVVLLTIIVASMLWFLYSLVRPAKDKTRFLENVQANIQAAIKENDIRATLEKDKIGAIKKIYDRKLKETKKIEDREERLKALIRLHEELDL
jgi:predicted Holliday junction resolvase-like endonuclease